MTNKSVSTPYEATRFISYVPFSPSDIGFDPDFAAEAEPKSEDGQREL